MGNVNNRKPIRCLETGVEYESITEAATALGCSVPTLVKALKGETETGRGYHWEYI